MSDDAFKPEELKLGDRLAIERTVLAADRTLLASVRTALSLMGFGFTIFKVLEQLQKSQGEIFFREQTPRNLGIFLILLGIIPLALSMNHYKKTVTRLGGKDGYLNPNMITSAGILLMGVALLVVIAMNLQVI